MKIFLKKVQLSYPAVFEAKSYEGSEPKFSASYLLDRKHPAIAEIEKAIEIVAKEKWGAKAEAVLKTIRAAGKTCLRDGDEKESDGYADRMFINASSKKRPSVVDRDGVTPLVESDGRPYGGCFVNAYVEIWAMDNQFGKRVCASLGGVQFHSDGQPFGSGGGADSFEAVSEEESLA